MTTYLMKTCPSCGQQNMQSGNDCWRCGTALDPAPPAVTDQPVAAIAAPSALPDQSTPVSASGPSPLVPPEMSEKPSHPVWAPPNPEAAVPPTFCRACGSPIDSRAVICPRCGVAQQGVRRSDLDSTPGPGGAGPTGLRADYIWAARRFRRWFSEQSTAIKAVVVTTAVVSVILMILLAGSAPSDGQSCVGASQSDIQAWVDSKSGDIPSGVSHSDVASRVSQLCSSAQNANQPQSFDNELLQLATGVGGSSSNQSSGSVATQPDTSPVPQGGCTSRPDLNDPNSSDPNQNLPACPGY